MEPALIYQHLEALLQRLGIPVRSERFEPRLFADLSSRGGLCRIQGKRTVLVDAQAPLLDRVAVLAGAAATIGVDDVYVTPAVRQIIEAQAVQPRAARDARSKPRRVRHLRLLHAVDELEPDAGQKGKAG